MNTIHRKPLVRRGVTLVELLVVVTIMMLLAAFAIPAVRPLTEGRRVREAARAIDVFLTQAKIRALEIQRPVGVLFERVKQTDTTGATVYQDDACNVLRMVEIPPPYSGDFTNSHVRIQNWTTVVAGGGRAGHPIYNASQINYIVLKLAVEDLSLSNRLLRWGDKVQFGFQGPIYTIVNDPFDDGTNTVGADFKLDADGYILFSDPPNSYPTVTGDWVTSHYLTVIAPADQVGGVAWPLTDKTAVQLPSLIPLVTGGTPPVPLWSADTTFQFSRQPEPSPTAPLRLPKETVIDLGDSGYYIGLPDPDSGTPAAEGSDVYDVVPYNERYAFEIYQQNSADYRQFVDAFGRIGDSGTPALDNYGPMILFAPNGAIQSVYHWKAALPTAAPAYASYSVTRPVFLMIGKWQRTGHLPIPSDYPISSPVLSLADDGLHNWQDASNLWIAIGPQNGMVTTAEVYAPAISTAGVSVPGDPGDTDQGNLGEQMQISRTFARQAQISKGALEE